MSDLFADLRRWQKRIAELPEQLAYIVIDHAQVSDEASFGRDAKGKRYVVVSPSILDSMEHRNYANIPLLKSELLPPGLIGTPVIRRCDLPEGWPAEAVPRA